MSLISAVQYHISQTTTATVDHPMVPLPPPPSQTPLIPPAINTNHSQDGADFRKRFYHTSHQPTDNSVGNILDVSINDKSYNGSIFDANVNRLA